MEAYHTICKELSAYGNGLAEKFEVVALNKIDALTANEITEKEAALRNACGKDVLTLSAVSGEGVKSALRVLMTHIAARGAPKKFASPSPKKAGHHEREIEGSKTPCCENWFGFTSR